MFTLQEQTDILRLSKAQARAWVKAYAYRIKAKRLGDNPAAARKFVTAAELNLAEYLVRSSQDVFSLAPQLVPQPEERGKHMTITVDSTGAVAVNRGTTWLPTGPDTPGGVKLLLINRNAGSATIGVYEEGSIWTHWQGFPHFDKREPE